VVVEAAEPTPHYDVGLAALDSASVSSCRRADEDDDVLVIYGVADEIRSGNDFGERGGGA